MDLSPFCVHISYAWSDTPSQVASLGLNFEAVQLLMETIQADDPLCTATYMEISLGREELLAMPQIATP